MGYALGGKPTSIKNYMQEFDPHFPNNRKGWHKRPMRDHCNDAINRFFSKWIPEYLNNYNKAEGSASVENSARRQRFRRSIPFGWVFRNGRLIMEVKDGNLVIPAP